MNQKEKMKKKNELVENIDLGMKFNSVKEARSVID